MTYTTEQGEMWDQIARKIYGSEKLMNELIAQNPELAHIFRFDAGVKIQYTEKVPENTTTIPAWRQVKANGT